MNTVSIRHLLIASAMLAFLPSAVEAQQVSNGAIVSTGTVSIEQKPSVLRMRVQLTEKDDTAEKALAKLADRKEAVKLQLESLGASADSIEITEAALPTEESDMDQQMRQMAMYQMRQNGRVPEGLKPIKSVTVTSTVTAEWPLTAEGNDELLIFVAGVKEKVVEADLAGLNEPKKLTPEEEELQAEMQEMQYYGQEESQPGEPIFLFVAKLSEDARSKAMAQAFTKAKAKAQRLADAAGVKLGSLKSLSADPSATDSDYSSYQYMVMQYAQQMNLSGSDVDSEGEVVAQSHDELALRVGVSASFAIE